MRGRLGIGTERILENGNHRHVRHSTRVSRPDHGAARRTTIVGRMEARWWSLRPAQNEKAATYVCPFCELLFHASMPHALVAPEGDLSKRRHAHTECVVAERKAGRFVTEDEWRRAKRSR
jgi:hypothetical protein